MNDTFHRHFVEECWKPKGNGKPVTIRRTKNGFLKQDYRRRWVNRRKVRSTLRFKILPQHHSYF